MDKEKSIKDTLAYFDMIQGADMTYLISCEFNLDTA